MSLTHHTDLLDNTRASDFAQWYQEVIRRADLAENSVVRGCMVIKPEGYALWEMIQQDLDRRFKATGHVNAYFPLLIPKSLIEKEAEHVEGFAKEMAVVTHHRLRAGEHGLEPDGRLAEPLVIRPTSETIIGESFRAWTQSYRDLPLLINQWANVMRWEMRPRLFLRTTEFLWQEGHTAHATRSEAEAETATMLEVYRRFAEDVMAVPVIPGEKTRGERFPGAVRTHTLEALMQDGKALQAGTSHYLGQNFARSSNIQFTDRDGTRKLVHTTSWGVSTRLIGGLVMTHADDWGLRLPPAIAPHHVVIIPMDCDDSAVGDAAQALCRRIAETSWRGSPIRCHIDRRDFAASTRRWQWIRRGAPLVIQVGAKDLANASAMVSRRWLAQPDRQLFSQDEVVARLVDELETGQQHLCDQATANRAALTRTDLSTTAELIDAYASGWQGAAIVGWNGDAELPQPLTDLAVTARCIPQRRFGTADTCAFTNEPATHELLLARAY